MAVVVITASLLLGSVASGQAGSVLYRADTVSCPKAKKAVKKAKKAVTKAKKAGGSKLRKANKALKKAKKVQRKACAGGPPYHYALEMTGTVDYEIENFDDESGCVETAKSTTEIIEYENYGVAGYADRGADGVVEGRLSPRADFVVAPHTLHRRCPRGNDEKHFPEYTYGGGAELEFSYRPGEPRAEVSWVEPPEGLIGTADSTILHDLGEPVSQIVEVKDLEGTEPVRIVLVDSAEYDEPTLDGRDTGAVWWDVRVWLFPVDEDGTPLK